MINLPRLRTCLSQSDVFDLDTTHPSQQYPYRTRKSIPDDDWVPPGIDLSHKLGPGGIAIMVAMPPGRSPDGSITKTGNTRVRRPLVEQLKPTAFQPVSAGYFY